MKKQLIFTILTILGITSTILIPTVSAQEDTRPVVYLTFDDGPSVNTPAYLDLLAEYDAHATFFMIGPSVNIRSDIAQRVVDEGHAVANHTWTHANLASSSASKIRSEFSLSQAAFQNTLNFTPTCFRPPYGATDAQVYSIQQEFGLTNADWAPRNPNAYQVQSVSPHAGTWDIDTNDWRRDPARVATELAKVQGGDVVLMHDLHTTSLTPLRNFLAANQSKFRFEALPGCGATSEITVSVLGQTVYSCQGEEATIVGTEGNDIINGTDGDDIIVALGGNDKIVAGDGDDIICGNDGDDHISGNEGSDSIQGGKGDDFIQGGKGPDIINGNNGEDTIDGNNGNDTIQGGNSHDYITGGKGNDTIEGNSGNDILIGGTDQDTLIGGKDNDLIVAGSYHDEVHADFHKDTINGALGEDTCKIGLTDTTVINCETIEN